jgi:restriction endonuclease Mrr
VSIVAFASSAASICNPTAVRGLLPACREAAVSHRRVGLCEARRERAALIAAVQRGVVPVSPRLRFDTAACWWLEHFEAKALPESAARARLRRTATSRNAPCSRDLRQKSDR